MSRSMCWAESLKPMGMPSEPSRTWSANRLKSSIESQSGKRGGETAGVPSGRPRTSAMRPTTLWPGRWPPVPGLGPLPALEVERLHLLEVVERPAEASRRQLVEVAAVVGLLLGQHAALARADARAGQLGALRQRRLGLLGQRAEAHVGHEDRDVEPQRLVGVGPDAHLGADRLVVEQREGGELPGDELQVVPRRQPDARHAHGRHRAVMAGLGQTVLGQLVDVRRRTAPRGPCADP